MHSVHSYNATDIKCWETAANSLSIMLPIVEQAHSFAETYRVKS
jgi:hypothetical protein